jgi:hypothetical protein
MTSTRSRAGILAVVLGAASFAVIAVGCSSKDDDNSGGNGGGSATAGAGGGGGSGGVGSGTGGSGGTSGGGTGGSSGGGAGGSGGESTGGSGGGGGGSGGSGGGQAGQGGAGGARDAAAPPRDMAITGRACSPTNPGGMQCSEIGDVCLSGMFECTCQASGAFGPLQWRCDGPTDGGQSNSDGFL